MDKSTDISKKTEHLYLLFEYGKPIKYSSKNFKSEEQE